MPRCEKLRGLLPNFFKKSGELEIGNEGRGRLQVFDVGGHAVVESPHRLVLCRFPITYSGMKQTHRHNLLCEDVIDELLAAFLRDSSLFPPVYVLLQLGVAIDVATNTSSELGMEVEVGGVLALQGDEIPVK